MAENEIRTSNNRGTIIIVIVIIVIIVGIYASSKNDDSTNIDSPAEVSADEVAPVTKSGPEPVVEVTPTYAIDEAVTAGDFDITASSPEVVTEIVGEYSTLETENQYVIVTLRVKNNDTEPRDVSGSMFTLYDADKRKYTSADISSDNFIVYETINPGLSVTFRVAFETERGLSGFLLEADSGVLFAGGDPANINLGI
jgi:hypothetical protein